MCLWLTLVLLPCTTMQRTVTSALCLSALHSCPKWLQPAKNKFPWCDFRSLYKKVLADSHDFRFRSLDALRIKKSSNCCRHFWIEFLTGFCRLELLCTVHCFQDIRIKGRKLRPAGLSGMLSNQSLPTSEGFRASSF